MVPLCSNCKDKLCEKILTLLKIFRISVSKELLESSESLKHKVVYIAKFLVQKYGLAVAPEKDITWNEYVEELNCGGLFFVCLHLKLYGLFTALSI